MIRILVAVTVALLMTWGIFGEPGWSRVLAICVGFGGLMAAMALIPHSHGY